LRRRVRRGEGDEKTAGEMLGLLQAEEVAVGQDDEVFA